VRASVSAVEDVVGLVIHDTALRVIVLIACGHAKGI